MLKNTRVATAMALVFVGGTAFGASDMGAGGMSGMSGMEQMESVAAFAGIDQVTEQLSGTWKTSDPIESKLDEAGNPIDVFMMMSVAPVSIEGMENTMYVESVLSDTPWSPFRQSIFQLYEYKGKVRLRTYTMIVSEDSLGLYSGMTATPGQFPALSREQLIATLDVELEAAGSGFSGSTPYPYPTGVLGAVEMTSSMSFDGTTLTTADRGYDADGEVVWGAEADSSYVFDRVDPYAVATELDDGLVIVDYPSSVSDMVVADGDEMHVHYSGFLGDGTMFDSSYGRNVPFVFTYPPGTRAIAGWGLGMDGLTLGGHRKVLIPGDLGYGPDGNPRANIPGGATLYFNVFLVHVDRPEAVEGGANDAAGDAAGDTAGGGADEIRDSRGLKPGDPHYGHDHD